MIASVFALIYGRSNQPPLSSDFMLVLDRVLSESIIVLLPHGNKLF